MNTPLSKLQPPITENAMIALRLVCHDSPIPTVADVRRHAKLAGVDWMDDLAGVNQADRDSIVAALEAFYVERGAI